MTGFGANHLPYGVFSVDGGPRRVGVRVGDGVLDLAFETARPEMAQPSLNPLMALGPVVWRETREQVAALVAEGAETIPLADVVLHLPFEVADYVDFYASEHHATNVGRMFRPDGDALPAAWKHLPIGYHGRAGTVVPSGRRSCGRAGSAARTTSARPAASTSRPSSASSSVRRRDRASRCRRRRSATTSSGWSGSTTGRRATCRRGSTGRSGPSSASPSRPRSATG